MPGWGEAAAPGRAECAAAWLSSGGQVGALGTLPCCWGLAPTAALRATGPQVLRGVPTLRGPVPPGTLRPPREQGVGRCVGKGLVSLLHPPGLPLMPIFCLQGLPPVPFGSGLAPEGAPPLTAEGLPERFTSPAERPAPSYSSMEEVD